MRRRFLSRAAPAIGLLFLGAPASADEGMWPFDMVPNDRITQAYEIALDRPLLERVMRASVRFNNGGSGSFVSSRGLVMTNHHVGSDCIQKLSTSTATEDYLQIGFYAQRQAEEQRCPDLELNALVSVEDVTARIRSAERAAGAAASEAALNRAHKAEMAEIEKECTERTELRCDVVTLYGGGAYHVYRYKKYTDVRLVFAPELDIAFFGGDPDNFNYPRHCLDVAFFRVYENDSPAAVRHHLSFSKRGAEDRQFVFISGHPGSTDRFAPVSKLEVLRDTIYPFLLEKLAAERRMLEAYMKRGDAQARIGRDEHLGVENAIKAISGYLAGLRQRELMHDARRRELKILNGLREIEDRRERERLLEAWPKLGDAYRAYGRIYARLGVLERGFAPGGSLTRIARHLLRLSEELPKPNGERLREYRDSNLKSLELALFSTAPIHDDFEVEQIAFGLENIRSQLGPDAPVVVKLLAGKTPRARAAEVIEKTKLADVAVRRRLYEEGKKAVDAAADPLIELVRLYDGEGRAVRKQYEDTVQSVERRYSGRIAEAYGRVFSKAAYPDATFTLRLGYGRIAGYEERGRRRSWRTTFGELYARHTGEAPYKLPERWLAAKSRIDPSTPLDFVSTVDIIGGNSGSPVLDRRGEVVGIIFDGNLHQLPNRFVYREDAGRSISVHVQAIRHALDRVYRAHRVLLELY